MTRVVNGHEIKPYANLEGSNLSGANLSGANLEGSNLEGSNLRGSYLNGANLTSANLRGANLRDVNFNGSILGGTNLRNAYLEGANLEGASLRFSDFGGANLRGAQGILRVGPSQDGYEFFCVIREGKPWVKAGCRWFTLKDAKKHWEETRGNTRLGKERLLFVKIMKQWAKLQKESLEK